MQLVSMAVDKDDSGAIPQTGKYGYGLRLCLNEDQCEALGITDPLRAGTVVSLQASAIVVAATESVEADGDDAGTDVSLSIQITDLGLKAQGQDSNAATLLYGD